MYISRQTTIFIAAGTLALGLIIGYFGGREHLKYQVASIFTGSFQTTLSGLALAARNGEKVAPHTSPSPQPVAPQPVAITLVKKGFKPSDIHNHDFDEVVTFELSIQNISGADIRAFDGALGFTDLLDNKIISLHITIDDPIKSGQTISWRGGMKYNQFMDPHQHLRNTAQENLKTTFSTRKIVYADGSSKDYGS